MRARQYSFRRLLRLREIAQVDRQSPDPFVGREIVRTAPSTRWSWRRSIAPTRKSPRNCKPTALPSVPSVIAWRGATRRRRHLKVADWDWRSRRQIGDRQKTGTRSAIQGGRVPAEPKYPFHDQRNEETSSQFPNHSFTRLGQRFLPCARVRQRSEQDAYSALFCRGQPESVGLRQAGRWFGWRMRNFGRSPDPASHVLPVVATDPKGFTGRFYAPLRWRRLWPPPLVLSAHCATQHLNLCNKSTH